MEYDHYRWASGEFPERHDSLRRASGLVIRSKGEMYFNGSPRRVDQGDILIIPPTGKHAGEPAIDLWTLSAAALILLAAARIFLDLY